MAMRCCGSSRYDVPDAGSLIVTVRSSPATITAPTAASVCSRRTRPRESRAIDAFVSRTIRLPSTSGWTICVVPSAEYGASLTNSSTSKDCRMTPPAPVHTASDGGCVANCGPVCASIAGPAGRTSSVVVIDVKNNWRIVELREHALAHHSYCPGRSIGAYQDLQIHSASRARIDHGDPERRQRRARKTHSHDANDIVEFPVHELRHIGFCRRDSPRNNPSLLAA